MAALALAGSCKRPEDQAAKARIFSPEEPQGAQAEAGEKLDAQRLAEDGALARRVLRMPQAEIAHRLGGHKALSRVQFAWFRGPGLPDGGSDVQLAEETALSQSKSGDFGLKLSNDHNQGFELVWAAGEAYVRGMAGPFHKRRTDRTDPDRVREQTMASLATFDRLARGLKLRRAGDTRLEGRPAVRYTVAGSSARLASEEKGELPPLQYPEPPAGQAGKALGPDPDTARRLEALEKEEPGAVSGVLIVDAETAAPLAADLRGHFKVPGRDKSQPAAELDLHAELITSELNKPVAVSAPQFEPDPSTPHAVKDPLRFLGKAAPAGAPSTEEPAEEEEEEAK